MPTGKRIQEIGPLVGGERADEMPEVLWAMGAEGRPNYYLRVEDDDDLHLRLVYQGVCKTEPGFLDFIGLSPDVSWPVFRAHYDRNGQPDLDRLLEDWEVKHHSAESAQVASSAANMEEHG